MQNNDYSTSFNNSLFHTPQPFSTASSDMNDIKMEDTTTTAWHTLVPNFDFVNAHSTSNNITQTSEQLEERNQTGPMLYNTPVKKMNSPSSLDLHDILASPCGRKWLKRQVEKKRNLLFNLNNHETGSSTDDNLTMLWTRCSQCKRIHRADPTIPLVTKICRINL